LVKYTTACGFGYTRRDPAMPGNAPQASFQRSGSSPAYQMEDFEFIAVRDQGGFAMIAFDQFAVQRGDDVGECVFTASDYLGNAQFGFRIFFLFEIYRHDHARSYPGRASRRKLEARGGRFKVSADAPRKASRSLFCIIIHK
jgi:hypothetical protein